MDARVIFQVISSKLECLRELLYSCSSALTFSVLLLGLGAGTAASSAPNIWGLTTEQREELSKQVRAHDKRMELFDDIKSKLIGLSESSVEEKLGKGSEVFGPIEDSSGTWKITAYSLSVPGCCVSAGFPYFLVRYKNSVVLAHSQTILPCCGRRLNLDPLTVDGLEWQTKNPNETAIPKPSDADDLKVPPPVIPVPVKRKPAE